MYSNNILPAYMPARQKRVPDLITDGCEPPYDCWELNSEPLEEQPVLLTAEPSLQPPTYLLAEPFARPIAFLNLNILTVGFVAGYPEK